MKNYNLSHLEQAKNEIVLVKLLLQSVERGTYETFTKEKTFELLKEATQSLLENIEKLEKE